MKDEKIEKMLDELAAITSESVRPGLAEDIKNEIPGRLSSHRGLNTINIAIDLRVSKLAAAAAIILTMILWANFFSGRDSGGNIYQDGKMLVKYCLGLEDSRTKAASLGKTKYEFLMQEGKEVVYYGGAEATEDSDSLLIQWKLPNGNYKVVFTDLSEKEVSADELIRLQAQMLQRRE